jgi:hypothetical protein
VSSTLSNVGNSTGDASFSGFEFGANDLSTDKFSCATQLDVSSNRKPVGVPSSAIVVSARLFTEPLGPRRSLVSAAGEIATRPRSREDDGSEPASA